MSIVPQLILNSIVAGAVYTMIALGFTLICSVTKFFNLAHGSLAAAGGYIVFYITQGLGWNIYGGIGLGVVGAACIGLVLEKIVFGPLLRRKASSMVLLVASLGVFTVIQSALAIIFTSQFQNLSVVFTHQRVFTILGGTITGVQLVTVLIGFLTLGLLGFTLRKTKFGKSVVAISDDEEVARIIGINTGSVIARTFVIGSAIAGMAGILIGLDTGIEPTMGLSLLLKGVIASVIGGLGSIYGAVAGAFLLGFVENFGIWKISGEWKDVIAFSLLILFLVFKPRGIFAR